MSGIDKEDEDMRVTDIRDLADRVQRLQHYKMLQERAEIGFFNLIADLKGLNDENLFANLPVLKGKIRETGRKWRLDNKKDDGSEYSGSKLIVALDATDEDRAEVHALLDAVLYDPTNPRKAWYKKTTSTPLALADFNVNTYPEFRQYEPPAIKTLGENGINNAVDPVFIIEGPEGKLKVLVGQRLTGENGLPGGILEGPVKLTCFNEVLEEIFSNCLFDGKDRDSTIKADQLRVSKKTEYTSKVTSVVALVFKGEKTKELADKVLKQLLAETSVPFSDRIKLIQQLIRNEPSLNDFEKGNLMVHLKCELFKALVPEQYNKLKEFVDSKLEEQDVVVNQGDRRNTLYAYMRTKPLIGYINFKDLDTIAEQCGLSFKGGDDLSMPKMVDIENLFDAYSDHPAIILNAVAKLVEQGKLTLTPEHQKQLKEFERRIAEKEPTEQARTALAERLGIEPARRASFGA